MPLFKSKKKSKKDKPESADMSMAYEIMRRVKKMAQGGLIDPSKPKSLMETKISDHFPTYDTRKQKDPEGYSMTQRPVEHPDHNGSNTDLEDESLQQYMKSRPSDKEDRSNVLFDGKAERLDPLKEEYREDVGSNHMGRRSLEEDDADADDIVSRIMRKMRRK